MGVRLRKYKGVQETGVGTCSVESIVSGRKWERKPTMDAD